MMPFPPDPRELPYTPWETLDEHTERLKVPGGWIVRSYLSGYQAKAVHQVYVPDPGHLWVNK